MHNSHLTVKVLMLEGSQASAKLNPVYLVGAITVVTYSASASSIWLLLAKALARFHVPNCSVTCTNHLDLTTFHTHTACAYATLYQKWDSCECISIRTVRHTNPFLCWSVKPLMRFCSECTGFYQFRFIMHNHKIEMVKVKNFSTRRPFKVYLYIHTYTNTH